MQFKIKGGKALDGEIRLAGAKNAATKAMIATLLTDESCELRNMPHIGDVQITKELCERVGSRIVEMESMMKIHTPEITDSKVKSLSRKNRIPILALGPLLARVGEAEIPFLGGDKIGPRPVDLHLKALEQMGAKFESAENCYCATAPHGLKGAKINFAFPSVGATENALLAAVLAEGRTILINSAVEPEVIDLIKLLQKMGAIIELGTNRVIAIEGVKKLHGAKHEIMPDRNEAVSFACLGLATGGRVFVRHAKQEHLINFLNSVRRIGGEYEVADGGIEFFRPKGLKYFHPIEIETDTHPGFMTDWQQPFAVVLTQASGDSVIHETIYEDRFGYTNDLIAMGASIEVSTDCKGNLPCRFIDGGYKHSAVIHGPTQLKAASAVVKDLRSGMVNVIASLIAEGESRIFGAEEITRGYEHIDERLRYLGADIVKVDD